MSELLTPSCTISLLQTPKNCRQRVEVQQLGVSRLFMVGAVIDPVKLSLASPTASKLIHAMNPWLCRPLADAHAQGESALAADRANLAEDVRCEKSECQQRDGQQDDVGEQKSGDEAEQDTVEPVEVPPLPEKVANEWSRKDREGGGEATTGHKAVNPQLSWFLCIVHLQEVRGSA